MKCDQGVLLIQTKPSVLSVQGIPCICLPEHMLIEMVHTDLRICYGLNVSDHLGTHFLHCLCDFWAGLLEAFEKTVTTRQILK